jgi:FkbM family methyltransferase
MQSPVDSSDDSRAQLSARYPAFDPAKLSRVAIVGSAGEGERFAELCRDAGIEIVGLYETNTARVGKWVAGKVVHLLESIERLNKDTPIVVASHRLLGPMDRMRILEFRNVAPLSILQILAPDRFPPHMFYDGWFSDMEDNRERYAELREALSDDMSRRTLDAILDFRLTLDVERIRPVIDWDVYFPDGLLSFGEDEVYVDGGAYEGDTINFFIDRMNGRYSRVIGFEPDPSTFAKLQANFADEPRVEAVNRGLYDHSGTLRFNDAGSRGSLIVDDGGVQVPITSLDEILQGDRVTYIKMNIEGAELKALEGARESLIRWKPKLAISGYHSPSDLWRVPEVICSINPDYRLYLRQHDGGVIESVIYAV